MDTSNLEKSETVITSILHFLIEAGRKRVDLTFEALGLEQDYAPYFVTSVEWLCDEDLIRVNQVLPFMGDGDERGDGLVVNPRLTGKALTMLGVRMNVGDETLLVRDVVEQSGKRSRDLAPAGDLVGGMIGGLMKSLGAG